MLTNSDCTVYSREKDPSTGYDTWKRQYVKECWWFEETKSSVTTDGLKTADVLKLRIPDLSIQIKKDDVLVKGNCGIKMETIKDLAGITYYKAVTANYNRFGDEPHIKVVGV